MYCCRWFSISELLIDSYSVEQPNFSKGHTASQWNVIVEHHDNIAVAGASKNEFCFSTLHLDQLGFRLDHYQTFDVTKDLKSSVWFHPDCRNGFNNNNYLNTQNMKCVFFFRYSPEKKMVEWKQKNNGHADKILRMLECIVHTQK